MLQVEKARLDHGKGQRVNQGDSCSNLRELRRKSHHPWQTVIIQSYLSGH